MDDARVLKILILAEPVLERAWEETLRGPESIIWPGRAAIPPGEHPDIILTNSHAPAVALRDEAGVIQVGGDCPADVQLPARATAAELQLACRLLGQVVSLRRKESQARQTHQDLLHAAMTDPLTGLANRRAWDQELADRLSRSGQNQPRLCLALLDLDQFKDINDTQGHTAGDRVLQAVATGLGQHLRLGDFVARLGGDEFGLLFFIPGEAEAAAIVERLRGHVADAAAGFGKLTASAGFALSGTATESDTCESLFLAGDAALMAAKRTRGDRLRT
jgi:diguanylate cyclase (GGDEF)-like protein